MTSFVLDACAIIHLHHGDVLGVVLGLRGYTFAVGPIVVEECTDSLRPLIEGHVDQGALEILDDNTLSAIRFATLLQRFRLGEGETECLAFAEVHDLSVCTDDRAARKAATELRGEARVTGTLGLLRVAVQQGRITAEAAMESYQRMMDTGAFFPEVGLEFFRGR